jgi:hypothetical protein
MRKPLPILGALAALSGVSFLLAAVLSMVSYSLDMQRHSVALSPRFHVGFFDGRAWFYSHEWPYTGSTIHISDGDRVTYGGSVGHRINPTASWRLGDYGKFRETYVGDAREVVGRDTGSDFPGIYYRAFDWVGHEPLWTLRISLLYPLLLLAGIPALWASRWLRLKYKERIGDTGRFSLFAFLRACFGATRGER